MSGPTQPRSPVRKGGEIHSLEPDSVVWPNEDGLVTVWYREPAASDHVGAFGLTLHAGDSVERVG